MDTYHYFPRLLLTLLLITCCSYTYAACTESVAQASALEGQVEVRHADQQTWQVVAVDEQFCPGDTVRVGENSRAALVLADHTLLRLGAASTVTITGPEEEKGFLVKLLEGLGHFMSRVPRTLEVDTPFVNAGIEGTEFLVQVAQQETFISVFEGKVAMENSAGRVLLLNGESAVAKAGTIPTQQVVAHPREAVQWTLYYPTVIASGDVAQAGEGSLLAQAIELDAKGESGQALSLLEKESSLDASGLLLRASLSLSVGQVTQAEQDINAVLESSPGNGDALALQSIITLVQGDDTQGLEIARAAVATQTDSVAPYLALSYALQSSFKLQEAREVLQGAAETFPQNALIYARLAELHLMFRDIEQADAAVQRAIHISPNNALAHMVQGFVYLVDMNTKSAKQAFTKAIQLDPAAPLPQLGLGLAMIREGELQEGRRAIEIAAILDPGNALIRSYLGKAYFEERRDHLANDQYVMAKALDPQDPTAYFYEAIYLQANNRPIEALDSMQEAMDKNDNRGVYRSRLLLDEDLATRGVSLARSYSALGFDTLASIEASRSLALDPTNYSAHRFLADSHGSRPSYEIARASELLQSQLMQSLNLVPLQPHATESDLAVVERTGVSNAAYNEYHPLFMRDALLMQTSVMLGGNNTKSYEALASGITQSVALSAGHYHYESEGFRPNNDMAHDIANLFAQWAVSPKLNLQAEYRYRESESGDMAMRFDLDDYDPLLRKQYTTETGRLGFHMNPSSKHHLIGSFVYQEFDEHEARSVATDVMQYAGSFPTFDLTGILAISDAIRVREGDSTQGELQYLFNQPEYSLIIGAGHLYHDYIQTDRYLFTFYVPDDRPTPVIPNYPGPNETWLLASESVDLSSDYRSAYFYFNSKYWNNQIWTIGASYDVFDYVGVEHNSFNPKLGFRWSLTPNTTLRSAWFKTTRRPFTSNQTIEPTQIAGFNQFYDEISGTESERVGVAIDHALSHHLQLGINLINVESEQVMFETPGGTINFIPLNERNESAGEVYLFWRAEKHFAISSRMHYEKIEHTSELFSNLTTLSIPLEVSYIGSNGFFTSATSTYVKQRVEPISTAIKSRDQFSVVDVSIGYQFPKRVGMVRLSVKNLFDRDFNYHDGNFTPYAPQSPAYQPERVVFGEVKLTF